jgi:hypothetical protein
VDEPERARAERGTQAVARQRTDLHLHQGPQLADPWYWTALDFRTGRTVYKRLAGTGSLYNNNYAGIVLGPDGSEYLGVLGGIISIR